MRILSWLLTVSLLLAVSSGSTALAEEETYDVVVYGGTSAAVAAAVQVKQMGKTVIVVSPDKHLGGLSSGGLGWTDSGRKEVIGGLAREFYQRLKAHYDRPQAWKHQKPEEYSRYRANDDAMWVFEPHVAEQAFDQWIDEYKIPVVREEYLDRKAGVTVKDKRIVAITTLSGKTFRGRMFLDTTYEGDLMAAAGVAYTVGREANAQYGETLNGVQTQRAVSHQFEYPVDPYVVPGDPTSGLLPRIHAGSPGEEGQGDHRVQAYCFRMCLTTVPENRQPFAPPEGYDAGQYELLARYLQKGWDGVFRKFDPAPNWKTDTNNHGAFSTDNIGMNYDYPDASYERRREIVREHEVYQKGLMYFLANDPRVPEKIRREMNRWGLAKDEFLDNGHWPHQIYVREARRMVSDFVMTELHLRGAKPTPDSVGMGSYNMDSHNVQRYVDENGHARNEGDLQINPGGPYPISYRAIVPKRSQCTNLLVPVCLSSSHIAYGSIRMEPVFMVLGQSAATASVLALESNCDVQAVDYAQLSKRLLADKQVLAWEGPRRTTHMGIAPAKLKGVVVDDREAKLTGNWLPSGTRGPFVALGYQHDGNEGQGTKAARFETALKPGRYEVRLAYAADDNRASNVPVVVHHAAGQAEVTVNQKKSPSHDQVFVTLGTFEFGRRPAVVEISNQGTDGFVIIDAVQFVPRDQN